MCVLEQYAFHCAPWHLVYGSVHPRCLGASFGKAQVTQCASRYDPGISIFLSPNLGPVRAAQGPLHASRSAWGSKVFLLTWPTCLSVSFGDCSMALCVLSIVPFGAAQEPQCAFLCCPAALAGISMLLSCLSIPFGVPFGVQQGPWCTLDADRMPWCVFQSIFRCGPVALTRPSKQHSCLRGGLSAQLRYLGGTFGTTQVTSVGLWVCPR